MKVWNGCDSNISTVPWTMEVIWWVSSNILRWTVLVLEAVEIASK